MASAPVSGQWYQPDETDDEISAPPALERLVSRAEKLFVWNNGMKDEQLISQIKNNLTGPAVRVGIKAHRKSLGQMPRLAEGGQIEFLMYQIEIDRFLADWDDYVAICRARASAGID